MFQATSLSELETLHQFSKVGKTQAFQSLALAALRLHHADYLHSSNHSNSFDYD